MFQNKNERVFSSSAKLSTIDIEFAKAYIKGAVHSFCENNPGEYFSVRRLFGGGNGDWGDTPLQRIYEYHKYINPIKDPAKRAAIDVGWLLKAVLRDDCRTFECVDGYNREYKLI